MTNELLSPVPRLFTDEEATEYAEVCDMFAARLRLFSRDFPPNSPKALCVAQQIEQVTISKRSLPRLVRYGA